MSEIGCFGKVPAHGDFVWQGLPARFVTPWDNWLQEQLLGLRQARPDDWLDAYLCGPIWRFVIRDDTLGPETWGASSCPAWTWSVATFPLPWPAPCPATPPWRRPPG